ncbi:DUF397 domain-containing protein [Streptomyces sp. SPB074]|uniref:DUF397 domain-containing protein n=1 Tax=Streptomyces sp. (strain SPB074) TaxID=465543 RepID=UPI00017F29A6|nr:DUF397 domain-containing protein [Streptomyces sp. SPB074]EDY46049.1 toxin-antitoxin system, toxin component [Streptomyces sp. SPB074]
MNAVPANSLPVAWRKSSYSNGGDANCVEIGLGHPTAVPVRDSKVPAGPALLVSPEAFSALIDAVATR